MAENSKIHDYFFNGDLSETKSTKAASEHESLEFYSPQILIENSNACRPNVSPNGRQGRRRLFMISLIHSHVNNDLRRKTMRETWLSMRQLRLAELYPHVLDPSQDDELHFSHLFIVGVDQRRRAHILESIRNESNTHKDILLIDLEEDYKNLIYKHLALVDWVCLGNSFFKLQKLVLIECNFVY